MRSNSDRPALNRQRVVAAALVIVDRDGVDGLTMRALGRQLGVDPMAAYYHLPNKDAILSGVVEAVWAELELPEPSADAWQSQLRRVAHSINETLARHPNALAIMATRPNLSAPGFRVVDHILGILHDAGLPAKEALEFVNAAGEFLLGHALAASGGPQDAGDRELLLAIEESEARESLPNLERVLSQVEVSDLTMNSILDAGLDALIGGIEARLDA